MSSAKYIGMDVRAGAELQKLLDHPGIALNSQWGTLARLGLARSFLRAADSSKAHDAYRDVFEIWKDADPDTPILKQAKAEYANLK